MFRINSVEVCQNRRNWFQYFENVGLQMEWPHFLAHPVQLLFSRTVIGYGLADVFNFHAMLFHILQLHVMYFYALHFTPMVLMSVGYCSRSNKLIIYPCMSGLLLRCWNSRVQSTDACTRRLRLMSIADTDRPTGHC